MVVLSAPLAFWSGPAFQYPTGFGALSYGFSAFQEGHVNTESRQQLSLAAMQLAISTNGYRSRPLA
jgi:hypothetical protein